MKKFLIFALLVSFFLFGCDAMLLDITFPATIVDKNIVTFEDRNYVRYEIVLTYGNFNDCIDENEVSKEEFDEVKVGDVIDITRAYGLYQYCFEGKR
jgi:hypothetical protein